ncbi:MAG: Nif3-like dinuclear metal center hexameric protein [Phycisphaerales bacterium]
MSGENTFGRRAFLKTTPLALGGIGVLAQSLLANETQPATAATVQDVIDRILEHGGVEPIEDTIDTIKTGSAANKVHGIVTTFMATTAVIRKTIELGADFIITHEPTFYNHADETDWLKDDTVYKHKRALLDDHGITVWRYHDHIHQIKPDPIFTGLYERLGWSGMVDAGDGRICHIPPTTLAELAGYCKQKLNVKAMRYVGDPALPCARVGSMPGAWGGSRQIGFLTEGNIDVLVCGEVYEWETNEYVRDSQHTDKPVGLIVTGHQPSEEGGMQLLADWLKTQYPAIPVTHLPAGDPFAYV